MEILIACYLGTWIFLAGFILYRVISRDFSKDREEN